MVGVEVVMPRCSASSHPAVIAPGNASFSYHGTRREPVRYGFVEAKAEAKAKARAEARPEAKAERSDA